MAISIREQIQKLQADLGIEEASGFSVRINGEVTVVVSDASPTLNRETTEADEVEITPIKSAEAGR